VRDWRQSAYVVDGQLMYDEYDISVLAQNDVGDAPSATRMIGYSGEDGQCLTFCHLACISDLKYSFSYIPLRSAVCTVDVFQTVNYVFLCDINQALLTRVSSMSLTERFSHLLT